MDSAEKISWMISASVLSVVVAAFLYVNFDGNNQKTDTSTDVKQQRKQEVFTQEQIEQFTRDAEKKNNLPSFEELERQRSNGYSSGINTKKYLNENNEHETGFDSNNNFGLENDDFFDTDKYYSPFNTDSGLSISKSKGFSTFSNSPGSSIQPPTGFSSSINDDKKFQTNQPIYGEYNVYGKDGKYLGKLNGNPYDPDSISNPYGRYGSQYSPDSVNNPYGKYGSPYSTESSNNPYTIDAPRIYDSNGQYSGKLSSNEYDMDSISNPYGIYSTPFK